MESIKLNVVYPRVFTKQEVVDSEIWDKIVDFQKGNAYLIKATSGKGKSSFCNFIYGTRNDYNGVIHFDDIDRSKIQSKEWDAIHQQSLSFVFQDLQLFPELTSIENILLKNNITNFKTLDEIEQMLDLLGIAIKKNSTISTLSYGQQQRVAIIRALCQPFDFLLLDEPISHLDDENAHLVASLVTDEVKKQKAGLLVMSIGKDLPCKYEKTLYL